MPKKSAEIQKRDVKKLRNARKGKKAVNSLSINEHFNALLRKICLFEPHEVRVSYASPQSRHFGSVC